MNIQLQSRRDISGWSSLFQILGYDLCIPIWDILGIPIEISDNPTRILEISKHFFSRGGEIFSNKEFASDKEVSNYLEARRMIDLGHLYKCFGKIVAYYGESTAICLFNFGEIHFVGNISRFWDDWYLVFSRFLKEKPNLNDFFVQEIKSKLLDTIRLHFEQEARKKRELKIRFEQMCEKYSTNLEQERDNLNQLLSFNIFDYEVTNDEGFKNVYDELEWVFAFDLLLSQICTYKIWKDFNVIFEKTIREKIFQLVVKEITLKDESFNEIKMYKDSYLSI